MPAMIGTSGWHYQHWKGGFYPVGTPPTRWLDHYARRFATVEVNNAFYRLPERSTFESWDPQLPDGFLVAVKVSRYLTHVRRLRDPHEPVARLMDRAVGLGEKLGPLLVQLPPNMRLDIDALEGVLRSFPGSARVAVEFRHQSWHASPVRAVMEKHNSAWCLTDRNGRTSPPWRTADWGYIRFHHGRGNPPSCYGQKALDDWASCVSGLWPSSADVFAYFNNDEHGCAPRDAHRFALAARHCGLDPTRTPPPRDTPVR